MYIKQTLNKSILIIPQEVVVLGVSNPFIMTFRT